MKKTAEKKPKAAAKKKPAPKAPKAPKKTVKKPAKPPVVKEKGIRPLTAKMLCFVSEYMVDKNATQAAIRAGYSKKTAGQIGERLLKKVEVSAEIKRRLEGYEKKRSLNIEDVLHRLAIIADTSLDDFLQIDEATGVATINLSKATPEQRKAIAEYQVDELIEGDGETLQRVRKVKIKMKDDLGALKMVGTYLKMFSEAKQRVTEATAKILRDVRDGSITIEQAAYEYAILGEPLPEVLKIKLAALSNEPQETSKPWTTEQIEARAKEMMDGVQKQIDQFLPERRQEVADMKESMKGSRGFDPSQFEGEE